MKKIIISFSIVIISAIALISCGNKGLQQAEIIPKSASLVLVLNKESMNQKLKTGNFDIDSTINNLISKMDSAKGTKGMHDLSKSGIDMNAKIIMFIDEEKKKISNQNGIVNLSFVLNDAKKFEAYLKSNDDLKNAEVKKGSNYSYIKIDDEVVISWNESTALFSLSSAGFASKFNPMASQYKDDTRDNSKSLKLIEKYYNLKDNDKITSINAFNKMMEKKADAYFFTSMNSLANRLNALPIQILKLEELLTDNYSAGFMNFENGIVNLETTTYYNDKLNSILKQYPSSNIKVSSLENFPVDNLNAAMMVSFSPEMIEGLLKELQLDGFVEGSLSKINVTTKELLKSLKGNFTFGIGDFSNPLTTVKQLSPEELKKNPPKNETKFFFNAEVADFTSLSKVLRSEMAKGMFVDSANVFTLKVDNIMMPMYIRIDSKNFTITESEATYNAYISGAKKATLAKSITSNSNNKNSMFYVNLNSFIKSFATSETKSTTLDAALNTFDEIVMTSNHIENGQQFAQGYLKLKSDKENSLVTMANFMKAMTLEVSEKMANREKELSPDELRKLDSALKILETK